MSFYESISSFHNQLVKEFNSEDDWVGPMFCYRLREEYDDELTISDRLQTLLEQEQAHELQALIIGAWSGSCEGEDCGEIVAELAQAAPQLPGLRALFFGELLSEECELSWIKQTDLSPLLTAFPRLETLRIRGGDGLSFSPVEQAALKELAIETGGLSVATLRELFQCRFPALERLELLLGESNYGFDGGVQDLQPVLSGAWAPRLKHLGLMNSEIANEIAAAIVNAPVLTHLESLDLSMGNLDDTGFRSLHGLAKHHQLKRLRIEHHYATAGEIAALKQALSCTVEVSEPATPDDEWRPILHAE